MGPSHCIKLYKIFMLLWVFSTWHSSRPFKHFLFNLFQKSTLKMHMASSSFSLGCKKIFTKLLTIDSYMRWNCFFCSWCFRKSSICPPFISSFSKSYFPLFQNLLFNFQNSKLLQEILTLFLLSLWEWELSFFMISWV